MKKKVILAVLVVFAFMAMTNFVLAGPQCGMKGSKGSTACSKDCAETCTIHTGDKASADCGHKGNCETASLKITGMTCGGCESSVTTALMEQEGVFKVVSIDHKSGMATICYDPTKVETAQLANLVTKKGYETEVLATVVGADAKLATGHKGCPGSTKAKTTETETESN